jgi:hypothetical protein
MNSISTHPPAATQPASGTMPKRTSRPGVLALGLAVYNVLIGVGAAYLIGDLLLGGPAGRGMLGNAETALMGRHLLLTVLGATLGSVLHSLFGLWVHACVLEDFRPVFTGSYLLGAFAAGLLGVGTFLVLQAGLLALGGNAAGGEDALRASLFYGAIGILVGLSFDAVLLRIDGVTRQLFGAPKGSFMQSAIESAQRRLAQPGDREGDG